MIFSPSDEPVTVTSPSFLLSRPSPAGRLCLFIIHRIRLGRILFKIAVELAILQNIVAATNEIDDVSLKRLRGECVKEVMRLKGSLDFDDALDWQKG